MKTYISIILSAVAISMALTSCLGSNNGELAFQSVQMACTPPSSSARYGKNQGPIIVSPDADTSVNTKRVPITITGTCAVGYPVNLSGPNLVGMTTTCSSQGQFTALATFKSTIGDGSEQIDVGQPTLAGQEVIDTRCFNQDATPPKVTISKSAGGGAQAINTKTIRVNGSCESGLNVVLTGPQLTNSVTTSCNDGGYSATITFTGQDGLKDLLANQIDKAGNEGQDNAKYQADTTPPVVTITSPAAMSLTRGTLTLAGTCETGIDVFILEGVIPLAAHVACTNSKFSSSIILTPGDGTKHVTAMQTDLSGNIGTATRDFVKDMGPMVAILTPPSKTGATNGLTITGSCATGLAVNVTGDITSKFSVPCNASAFTADILFAGGLGNKNVTVTQTDSNNISGSDTRTFVKANNAGYELIISKGPGGKVDIIFVDDNSESMDNEQNALGARFSAFAATLASTDWQIGIITTDCTAGSAYNFCGQLLKFPGGENILTKTVPNYLTEFKNTIERPETMGCTRMTCPSGNEEGLKSTIQAMALRNTTNAGFFRPDADLAVIELSDEDEQSNGDETPHPTATKAANVMSAFTAAFGAINNKKFTFSGIIIQPRDNACLMAQKSQLGANGYYGQEIANLATDTDGVTASICTPDYTVPLQQIAQNVTRLGRSIDLAQTPKNGAVNITFTPSFNTTWTVVGNRVTFSVIPPQGTKMEITYIY